MDILAHIEGNPCGPTIVFIHGFPDGPALWNDTSIALARDYRIIRITLPGFGPNPKPDFAAPFDALVDDLYQTLKRVDSLGATVIGHDWGAIVIYLLLTKYPNAASRVVCLEVGCGPVSWWLAANVLTYHLALIVAHRIGGFIGDFLVHHICRFLGRPASAPRAKSAGAWLYRQAWRERAVSGPWWLYYRNRIRLWRPQLSVPFLFLYGQNSPRWARFHTKQWRDEVTAGVGSRAVALPGRHWFLREYPAQFHTALRAFLYARLP